MGSAGFGAEICVSTIRDREDMITPQPVFKLLVQG